MFQTYRCTESSLSLKTIVCVVAKEGYFDNELHGKCKAMSSALIWVACRADCPWSGLPGPSARAEASRKHRRAGGRDRVCLLPSHVGVDSGQVDGIPGRRAQVASSDGGGGEVGSQQDAI